MQGSTPTRPQGKHTQMGNGYGGLGERVDREGRYGDETGVDPNKAAW
jgi:hypothetical protein